MPSPQLSQKSTLALRRRFKDGITIEQMVEHMAKAHDDRISIPAVRKYIQLHLVERSKRRGNGSPRGSKGYYPITALFQLMRVRAQIHKGKTLDQLAAGPMRMHTQLEQMQQAMDTCAEQIVAASRCRNRETVSSTKSKVAAGTAQAKVGLQALAEAIDALEV